MKYRPEIDGLRAIAVVPVILFHANFPFFTGGYVGVDVFFVISGYLITTILIGDLTKGTFSILDFYDRRIRRILPPLFTVIVVSMIAGWFILLPEDYDRFAVSAIATTTFWSNILFWTESGYFDTATELKPLLHTWSLAVEEQYYIFFPILLAVFWRAGKAVIVGLLLFIFLLSLGLGVFDFSMFSEREAAFYLIPTRAWELMLGSLVAFYMVRPVITQPNLMICGALSALGVCLIAYAIVFFNSDTPYPSLSTLAPTVGTALIILFERKGTWSFQVLSNPVFLGIGLISYSAYLWHQPLFAYARYLSTGHPSLLLMGGLSLCALGLAWLSYYIIEKPFRNRSLFERKEIFIFSAGSGGAIIAASFAIWASDGAPSRYASKHIAVFQQYNDPGRYVRTRFKSLRLSEFNTEDPRKKLLVIGDSYGEDAVNAIYESALKDRYQTSTFRISSRCGNLFLKRDMLEIINPKDHHLCKRSKGYLDEELQKRMGEADEIWLVSSWRDWHVEHLAESVSNISEITDAKIRILGRKQFGSGMSLRRYWSEYSSGNETIEVSINAAHTRINREMKRIFDKDLLIDVSNMMCGSETLCRNTTENNLLISYDGGHLTKAGAALMGQRLFKLLDQENP